MAKSALEQYGYQLDPDVEKHFNLYRKTHNDGVFDAYPERIRVARSSGLLTGLPDAYGRGRIVGDYRRVPLYGTDFLIESKKADLKLLDGPMTDERIRLREDVSEQIRALKKMAYMAAKYGCDITQPAENAHEAVQNLYMAYLAGHQGKQRRSHHLWAGRPPSWIFTSREDMDRRGPDRGGGPRSSWTSLSSSCGWCAI